MTEPIIGTFDVINVAEAKNSEDVGESEAELIAGNTSTSQYKVLTMAAKVMNRNASGIWNYFGVAEKQNSSPGEQKQKAADRILCLVCFEKSIVHVYKPKTSSGNLWRHLHRKHGIPIPKDRISGTAINVRANYEITDVKNIRRHYIEEDIGVRAISNDDQSMDAIMPGDSFRSDSDTFCKDIGSMLITEVSKRPALFEWNSKTLTNPKKAKRDILWQEVYESLGKVIELDRLQKMWKNIRDRYKKLKNLEQEGMSEASSRYKYYDQLKFLENLDQSQLEEHCMIPTPYSVSNNSRDTQIHSSFDSAVDDSIDFVDSLVSHNDEVQPPEKKLKFNDTADENESKMYTTLRSPFENRIASYGVSPEISTTENISVVEHTTKDYPNSYPDEFDLFGRLIAEKLRKLPISRVDDIEIKILQLIKREEVDSMQ